MSRYAVVITGDEGRFSAYAPDLPGCMVTGESLEVIQKNMRVAIAFRLGSMQKEGKEVKEPESLCGYVDVETPPGSKTTRGRTNLKYAVILVRVESGFSAYVPDLPGCMARGGSLDAVKAAIQKRVYEQLVTSHGEGKELEGPQSRCGYVVVNAFKSPTAVTDVSAGFSFLGSEEIPHEHLWWSPSDTQRAQMSTLGVAMQVRLGKPGGQELSMTFVLIPRGSFEMGSPRDEIGRDIRETLHRVELTRSFYLKSFPVTKEEWYAVMGNRPAHFRHAPAQAPIESITWYDAIEFCNKLSEFEGRTPVYKLKDIKRDAHDRIRSATVLPNFKREGYRLPTEAEWEYACRAGTATAIYAGDMTAAEGGACPELDAIAWYAENCSVTYEGASEWVNISQGMIQAGTHPVCQKEPNSWGLYDMLGNVWEWCWDRYEPYATGLVLDPVGSVRGEKRVMRGGAWSTVAKYCRAAKRVKVKPSKRAPILGLRLVLPEPQDV